MTTEKEVLTSKEQTYEIVGLTREQAFKIADDLVGGAVWGERHVWISETCVVRPQGCECAHCLPLSGDSSAPETRKVFNHERDCGLTNDVGICECPQPSVETSALRLACSLDAPWPLPVVLEKLIEIAEIAERVAEYPGRDSIIIAVACGKGCLQNLRAVLDQKGAQETPASGLFHNTVGCIKQSNAENRPRER